MTTAVVRNIGSALALLGFVASTCWATAPTITLPNGSIVNGFIDAANPDVEQYLGIPFGAAPVGDLRFSPPTPTQLPAILNATTTPFACPQFDPNKDGDIQGVPVQFANTAPIGEDCLNLNIWAPKSEDCNGSLPVLIFIFGGGFLLGSNTVPYQNPTRWIQKTKNLIIAEMNYRTNIFGFPNAAGLDPTKQNLGLMDQRQAVEWLRDNIASFGGDPSQMVLWGQSAGAASVDMYNFAHYQNPIVKGSIMDSGFAGMAAASEISFSHFTSIASKVGCANLSAAAELACMRKVSMQYLLSNFTAGLATGINFGPVADGVIVFSNYTQRALDGKIANTPAIFGSNSNEGISVPSGSLTCGVLQAISDQVLANYTRYRYLYSGNFTNIEPSGSGAVHSSELPLLFGTHQDYRGNSTQVEYDVSAAMQSSWFSFLIHPATGPDNWPPYTLIRPNVREFGALANPVTTIQGNPLDSACL